MHSKGHGDTAQAAARPATPPELGDRFVLVRYMSPQWYSYMDSLYKLHKGSQWISSYDVFKSTVLGAPMELQVEPQLAQCLRELCYAVG